MYQFSSEWNIFTSWDSLTTIFSWLGIKVVTIFCFFSSLPPSLLLPSLAVSVLLLPFFPSFPSFLPCPHPPYLFIWWMCGSLKCLRDRMGKKRCATIKILILDVWSGWEKMRHYLKEVFLAVPTISKSCWCFFLYHFNSDQGLKDKVVTVVSTLLTRRKN